MAKEKHVGGLDVTKTQTELAAGLKDFLTKATPDGLSITAAKILNVDVKTDAAGKPKGFAFVRVEDDVDDAVIDVTDKVTPIGKITISTSKGKAPTPTPPAPTPAPTSTTPPAPVPVTPTAPAPAPVASTPPTTPAAPHASDGKKLVFILIGIVTLIALVGGGIAIYALGKAGRVETRIDNLDQRVTTVEKGLANLPTKDDSAATEKRLTERIGRIEQDGHIVPPAPAPAPAPVPAPVLPVPAPAPAPTHVAHHPVDDGHSGAGQRTRNDEQDARIAALEGRMTANEGHDGAQDAQIAEQARIQQVLVEWNGADACRRSDARSRQGCQYLEQELGRQFE